MGLVWSGFRLARRAARALRGAAAAGRGAGLRLRDGLDEANRLGGGRRDERLVERLWHARRAVRASSLAQRSKARKRAWSRGHGSMGWVIIPGERSMDATALADADGRCMQRRPLVSPSSGCRCRGAAPCSREAFITCQAHTSRGGWLARRAASGRRSSGQWQRHPPAPPQRHPAPQERRSALMRLDQLCRNCRNHSAPRSQRPTPVGISAHCGYEIGRAHV